MSSVQFEYLAPISKQQQTLACPLLVQIIFGSHADLGAPTSKIGEKPITNLPSLESFLQTLYGHEIFNFVLLVLQK